MAALDMVRWDVEVAQIQFNRTVGVSNSHDAASEWGRADGLGEVSQRESGTD